MSANSLQPNRTFAITIILIVMVVGCTTPAPPPTSTIPSSTLTTVPSPTKIPTEYTKTPEPGQPEAAILFDAGYASSNDRERFSVIEEWAGRLSLATGMQIAARAGPPTEMEILEALGSGEMHIATLSPLAYLVGTERGWIRPGLEWDTGQEAAAVMFVARKDSGLLPGEPPEVFNQLAGKRPCWPKVTKSSIFPPTANYIIPSGLLAVNSVETGTPVYIESKPDYGFNPGVDAAVFRRECDFAVVDSLPEETYLAVIPAELFDTGVAFEEWTGQMQILYTTFPLIPNYLIAFSTTLSDEVTNKLGAAILATPPPFEQKFRAFDASSYVEFERIVTASGLDLEQYFTLSPFVTEEPTSVDLEGAALPPGTIVIDIMPGAGDPLLPGYVGGHVDRLVLQAIYAELVRLDAEGNYFPYLAAELPTLENGLVRFVGIGENKQLEVEFRLRPFVKWQDGQPVTTADLVFSWEYIMQPGWPGSRWGNIARPAEIYVAGVEALSPERILYRFMSQRQARQAARNGGRLGDPTLYADLAGQEGPVVPLDFLEAGRNVLPRHLLESIPVEKIAGSEFARRPVYAGAYRVVQGGSSGQPIVLEAFEDFFLGKPAIQRVVFGASYAWPQADLYWQAPEDLGEAMRSGVVQAQLGLPAVRKRDQGIEPQAYDVLARQGLANVTWAPRNSWETFDFNLDNPHLADLKVRQAIAHAIDRQAIIDLALGGHGELMRSYLPSWHPLYATGGQLPDYGYDPDRARSLLAAAGYDLSRFPAAHPNRGRLTLELASMDVAAYPRQGTAGLIREQLAQIGIQVEVQFYEWPKFEGQDCSAIRNGRQFDLGMAGWLGIDPYATWYVEHVTASWNVPGPENGCPLEKANWSGWSNARVDELVPLLKDGRLALEQPQRYRQLWAEHQELWATELPSLPLFNSQRPITVVPGLAGVQPSPLFARGVEDSWNSYEWQIRK